MRMLQSKHLNFAIKYILKKHLKYCLASGSPTILNDHPVRGLSILNRGILTPRSECRAGRVGTVSDVFGQVGILILILYDFLNDTAKTNVV